MSKIFEEDEINLKEAFGMGEAMDLQETVEEVQREGELDMKEDKLSVGKLKYGYAIFYSCFAINVCTD